MITKELLIQIKEGFLLDWRGIHGAPHWSRVRENGLRLARSTGANVKIVELFAMLHDSRRRHDGSDREHGKRAVEFAESLRGTLIDLSDREFDLLSSACADHSKGLIDADITVQTCWDADRLDLGRVGIKPDAAYLSTTAAKDPQMIEWAYLRSNGNSQRSNNGTNNRPKNRQYKKSSQLPFPLSIFAGLSFRKK